MGVLAGLDLATALMRLDRLEEALAEGVKSAEMFLTLSVHRELLGTVLLLRDSLEEGTAELEELPEGYRESMSFGMIGYGIPLERYPDIVIIDLKMPGQSGVSAIGSRPRQNRIIAR